MTTTPASAPTRHRSTGVHAIPQGKAAQFVDEPFELRGANPYLNRSFPGTGHS